MSLHPRSVFEVPEETGEHQKPGANFWGNIGGFFKLREFLPRSLQATT